MKTNKPVKDIDKIKTKKAIEAVQRKMQAKTILTEENKKMLESKHYDALQLIYRSKPEIADGMVQILNKLEKDGKNIDGIKEIIWLCSEYVFTKIVLLLKNDKNGEKKD